MRVSLSHFPSGKSVLSSRVASCVLHPLIKPICCGTTNLHTRTQIPDRPPRNTLKRKHTSCSHTRYLSPRIGATSRGRFARRCPSPLAAPASGARPLSPRAGPVPPCSVGSTSRPPRSRLTVMKQKHLVSIGTRFGMAPPYVCARRPVLEHCQSCSRCWWSGGGLALPDTACFRKTQNIGGSMKR